MTTISIIFWVSVSLVVYTWVAYPLLIWGIARVLGRRVDVAASDDAILPSVSLLIAAHNEQAVIEERIINALACDYPKDKLQIVIASDGSSDRTNEIVRKYAERGVRLFDYAQRRGKASVLNSAVREIKSDIIVLSDANTMFDATAMRKLVIWFSDRRVGVVCGALVLIDHLTGRNVDGMYWRYETFLKKCEGKVGALLGSNGAIYAIRRDLFPRIPDNTIVDDFVIPLLAKLRTGCRIVYEPSAIAREEVAPEIGDEFRRRARIGAGGYQAMTLLWPLLNPRHGWIALSFFSHKVLRWVCPLLLLMILCCSVILHSVVVYRMALFMQLGVFLITPVLSRIRAGGPLMKPIRLAAMFTLMNLALFVGFFRWLRKSQGGAWARTMRSAEITGATPLVLLVIVGVAMLKASTCAASATTAPTYFVSADGDDKAAGNEAQPWRTLQKAGDAVAPGDTVIVRSGNYAGFVMGWDTPHSGSESSPITFNADKGATIISRNNKTPDAINLEGCSYINIAGFVIHNDGSIRRAGIRAVQGRHIAITNNTIDGMGTWGIFTSHLDDVLIDGNEASRSVKEHGIYVSNSGDRPVIRANHVWGNRAAGIHMNGDASQGGDGIISGAAVENNEIHDNGIAGGAGINADGVQESLFKGNVLYRNHSAGIALFRGDGAAGSKNNKVINNTIVMASDSRWALIIKGGSTGNVIQDNILLNESSRRGSIEMSPDSAAGLISDCNIVVDRFSNDDDFFALKEWRRMTGQDARSVISTSRLLFVDPDNGDFHLVSTSPAVGRAHDGGDIGAFHHTPGAAAVEHSASRVSLMWPLSLAGISIAVLLRAVVVAFREVRNRGMDRWLGTYLSRSCKRIVWGPAKQVHLLLCVADHFEPGNGKASKTQAQLRVERWLDQYPKIAGQFRDADGRPPQHTFFYPIEQYTPAHVAAIASLCRQGFGEVEVHLHHDNDTAANLRQTLLHYTNILANEHQLLSRNRWTNEVGYGFIHGNWALCNARRDGRWCGVNNELDVLRETGCYADFTMPSAPSDTQVKKINSIYYARTLGSCPRSHETGVDVGLGPRPKNSLMMIQGPLLLNWQNRKWGLLPRVENSCIQRNQPPTMQRLDLWLRASVQVRSRPDWHFVKLHTHGAPEANQSVLLGEAMIQFHAALAARATRDSNFNIHYVTAREMYNLARAAEDECSGSVQELRDYEMIRSCDAAISPRREPALAIV